MYMGKSYSIKSGTQFLSLLCLVLGTIICAKVIIGVYIIIVCDTSDFIFMGYNNNSTIKLNIC